MSMIGTSFARARARFRKARRLPAGVRLSYAVDPIVQRAPLPFAARAARALDLDPRQVTRFFNEAREGWISQHIIDSGGHDASGTTGLVAGAFLYALVRAHRPEIAVETGVANGMSSAFMLAALEANEAGRLISIDLPFTGDAAAGEPVPLVAGTTIDRAMWSPVEKGRNPGWLVPAQLRERWDLRIGDARDLLPRCLDETGDIGLFYHDSLHTPEYMLFEFRTAWRHLMPGGLLATDDIMRKENDAIMRFSTEVGRKYVVFSDKAMIRKRSL